MNEKYPYGICHICTCAITIPGGDNYYCSSCSGWIAYPKSTKLNNSAPTQPTRVITYRLPKSQLTLPLEGSES